jgi:hypothetical protein
MTGIPTVGRRVERAKRAVDLSIAALAYTGPRFDARQLMEDVSELLQEASEELYWTSVRDDLDTLTAPNTDQHTEQTQ